jgi:hypothetical protein
MRIPPPSLGVDRPDEVTAVYASVAEWLEGEHD